MQKLFQIRILVEIRETEYSIIWRHWMQASVYMVLEGLVCIFVWNAVCIAQKSHSYYFLSFPNNKIYTATMCKVVFSTQKKNILILISFHSHCFMLYFHSFFFLVEGSLQSLFDGDSLQITHDRLIATCSTEKVLTRIEIVIFKYENRVSVCHFLWGYILIIY